MTSTHNNSRSYSSCDDKGPKKNNEDLTLEQKIHKATVAAGGGALVLLGICLTPVPILPVVRPHSLYLLVRFIADRG